MLVPIIIVIVGVVAGGAIGFVLKPEPPSAEMDAEAEAAAKKKAEEEAAAQRDRSDIAKATDSEYLSLSRKIIVPFRRDSGRKAFVAIDINLELAPGESDFAKTHEPKLIDAFLRTIVAFAATGAFDDDENAAHILDELNEELLNAAQIVLGEGVRQVLIANLLTRDA